MRYWDRADCQTICGGCGEHIPKHAVVQVIQLGKVTLRPRCETCADGPVPVDLPEKPAKSVAASGRGYPTPEAAPLRELAAKVAGALGIFDWKTKAANDER